MRDIDMNGIHIILCLFGGGLIFIIVWSTIELFVYMKKISDKKYVNLTYSDLKMNDSERELTNMYDAKGKRIK
jgi:hypothetical protein